MIVTVQPFFNELDHLEVKCEELKGVVDLHIIVEANKMFTGFKKPLYFQDNKNRFKKYPIRHEIVQFPDDDGFTSPWQRHDVQYRTASDIVRSYSPEIVMWLDTDECPRRDTIRHFRETRHPVAQIGMDILLYDYSHLLVPMKEWASTISFYTPDQYYLRHIQGVPNLGDMGWHFSCFGSKEQLIEKANSSCHTIELGNTFVASIERGERPNIENTVPYPVEKLPEFVQRKLKQC